MFTHPLKLQLRPYDLSDDSRWYKIEAERTGHVASLRVRMVKPENDGPVATEGVTVSGAGPPRFTKMDLVTGDKLYIGRVPDNAPADFKVCVNCHLRKVIYLSFQCNLIFS